MRSQEWTVSNPCRKVSAAQIKPQPVLKHPWGRPSHPGPCLLCCLEVKRKSPYAPWFSFSEDSRGDGCHLSGALVATLHLSTASLSHHPSPGPLTTSVLGLQTELRPCQKSDPTFLRGKLSHQKTLGPNGFSSKFYLTCKEKNEVNCIQNLTEAEAMLPILKNNNNCKRFINLNVRAKTIKT